MSELSDTSNRKRGAWTGVLLLLIFAVLVGIFILMIFCCPRNGIESPDDVFGNDQFNTTYQADALAITTGGEWIGDGIESTASPPTIVFSEDFETDLSGWDVIDDAFIATDRSYFDDQSVVLNNSNDDHAELGQIEIIPVAADETIQAYFFILAHQDWDDGDNDFLAFKIFFDGGKALVYEVLGDYPSINSSEAIIDISSQVTALGLWVGVDIERIDEDYIVQFSTSLPVPDIVGFSFELDSDEVNETAYIDELEFKITPKPIEGDGFWEKRDTDIKTTSYFVLVKYFINTSGDIDNDSVYAEFTLWITVYDDEDKTSVVLPLTMIQDDLISPAIPNVNQTWLSKVFALPEDDTVLGGELWFEFSIRVEVWGELESKPGTFLYSSDEAEAFDCLAFVYTAIDGSIDVIIWTLGGISGAAGAFTITSAFLARKKRRKGDCSIDGTCSTLSERESLYN